MKPLNTPPAVDTSLSQNYGSPSRRGSLLDERLTVSSPSRIMAPAGYNGPGVVPLSDNWSVSPYFLSPSSAPSDPLPHISTSFPGVNYLEKTIDTPASSTPPTYSEESLFQSFSGMRVSAGSSGFHTGASSSGPGSPSIFYKANNQKDTGLLIGGNRFDNNSNSSFLGGSSSSLDLGVTDTSLDPFLKLDFLSTFTNDESSVFSSSQS